MIDRVPCIEPGVGGGYGTKCGTVLTGVPDMEPQLVHVVVHLAKLSTILLSKTSQIC